MRPKKILLVAGARPNFIKLAPLLSQLRKYPRQFTSFFVHGGQHALTSMSADLLKCLQIGDPDFKYRLKSKTRNSQISEIMSKFELTCRQVKPDLVVVFGDVSTTVAAGLASKNIGVPLAHVEAGLRSFDRTMPEELNRRVVDSISDFLFTPSLDATQNLINEGRKKSEIFLVGNIMIDALKFILNATDKRIVAKEFGFPRKDFGVVTLHRPSNVDSKVRLRQILDVMINSSEVDLLFPVHPRLRIRLREFGLDRKLRSAKHITTTGPLSYDKFIGLLRHAKLVITDSGGIQEETTFLGIPCLTLRENTERPITLTHGSNKLITPEQIPTCISQVMHGTKKLKRRPPLWDGKTSERIVRILGDLAY